MANSIPYYMVNEVMNVQKSETTNIVPGMGATYFIGSDSYAMVVTEVLSPKSIMIAHAIPSHEDKFVTNEDGLDILPEEFLKEYEKFVPDEFGYKSYNVPRKYTLRKNHRWVEEGRGLWDCGGIHIGHAESYRDPSF